jgi:hypothetical protein
MTAVTMARSRRPACCAAAVSAAPAVAEHSLSAQLEEMLASGVGSDVTLSFPASAGHAPPASLRAHSFILRARSGMFFDMLSECTLQRNEPLTVREGFGAETFKILLRFLYTDFAALPTDLPYTVVVELLEAAEFYRVPNLQLMCKQTLATILSPDNMLDILKAADRERLRSELRDLALRYIAKHLLIAPDFAECDSYLTFVTENPKLSIDITLTLSNNGHPPEWKDEKRLNNGAADAAAPPKRSRVK